MYFKAILFPISVYLNEIFCFLHSLLSLPLKQKDLTNDNTLVPSLHFESIWVRRKKKESEFTAINLLQSKLAYIAARPPQRVAHTPAEREDVLHQAFSSKAVKEKENSLVFAPFKSHFSSMNRHFPSTLPLALRKAVSD